MPGGNAQVGEFDPLALIVDFNGNIIHGWGEGTMLRAKYDEARVFKRTGADGEGVRILNRNRAGSCTLSLGMQSASNDMLSAQAELNAKGPLIIKDLSGRTLFHAKTAWVAVMPDKEFAKQGSDVEWVLETDRWAIFTVGGN